jgi:hypothetical protein
MDPRSGRAVAQISQRLDRPRGKRYASQLAALRAASPPGQPSEGVAQERHAPPRAHVLKAVAIGQVIVSHRLRCRHHV